MADFQRITPEEAGISSLHVREFLKAAEKAGLELHSFMFLRKGKVFAEGWYSPYEKDIPHIMFSFTKSLTSTAIGFAWQEGHIKLDERLVDIFPEEIPENPSENLKLCTVKDLLTMGCGHDDEIPNLGVDSDNWIRCFLSHSFVHKPGTKFVYNTAGTNMLVAVLQRKTGKNLMEYLEPRLFAPLGMNGVSCFKLPDGTDIGGAGSRLTTENMARFTQFVANGGSWDGKQLLSSEWFQMASSKQIDNAPNWDPNWEAGYGFQFWRCTPKNTFRGDGAFGQFGVVCQDEEAVFVVQSASTNFAYTLDLLFKHIKDNFKPQPLPADNRAHSLLVNSCGELSLRCPLSKRSAEMETKLKGLCFKVKGSCPGLIELIGGAGLSLGPITPELCSSIEGISLEFSREELKLSAHTHKGIQLLHIGMESSFSPSVLGGLKYGAAGTWICSNVFQFEARCASAATGSVFTMDFADGGISLRVRPSIPSEGGLGDYRREEIIFTRKDN